MPNPDERPNPADDPELSAEVEQLLRQGETLLTGPCSVELMIRVEDAATPLEAVDGMIGRIAHHGMATMMFAVTDMLTGDTHFVQNGQLLNLEEVQEAVEASRDA